MTFTSAATLEAAQVRIRWISPGNGVYGETQRVFVNGKPGAVVNVMPDVSQQGEALASLAKADRETRPRHPAI